MRPEFETRSNGMKRLATAVVMLAIVLSASNAAMAQNQTSNDVVITELEVTMVLIPPDAARPDVITKTIELPAPATPNGGQDNEASENRQTGLDTAEDARERGREFGQEMAEQARENREDAGRGNAPDEPPGGPPDDVPNPQD
jgi:hypothetical protein